MLGSRRFLVKKEFVQNQIIVEHIVVVQTYRVVVVYT
jgi:hypothetical protein